MSSNSHIDLISILGVDLILEGLAPYLPFPDLQNLAATSRTIRLVLQNNPSAYRRLDLSVANGTLEHVFGAFVQSRIGLALLKHARILILDGQSVDSDSLRNLLLSGDFQVRILSIIGVKDFDEQEWASITQLLGHHAELIPEPRRLRGIYCFPPTVLWRDGYTHSVTRQASISIPTDHWYGTDIRVLPSPSQDQRMQICATQGRLAWDAVLCRGPRHEDDHLEPLSPRIATFALGVDGCANCGTLPEGPGSCPEELPLLDPPPFQGFFNEAVHSPPRDAKGAPLRFFARCKKCVEGRLCHQCRKFYCENCDQATGRPLDTGRFRVRYCSECVEVCGHCQKLNYRICYGCDVLFCHIDAASVRESWLANLDPIRPEYHLKLEENILFWEQLCLPCLQKRIIDLKPGISR